MEDFDDTVITPRRETPSSRDRAVGPPDDETVVRPRAHIPRGDARPAVEDRPVSPNVLRFRLTTGSVTVDLDVPAYIGRRPSSPRIVSGIVPRLVRVASPQLEVSSTHVELRQVGASVVVTDMRSTNGSVVTVPGHPARKLRPAESVVVSPGTLIDVGDGNVIEILPARRDN